MVYIAHYFGRFYNKNKEILCANLSNEFYVSDDISLLSVMNESCDKDSVLSKQCLLNGVDLHIPQCTYNIQKEEWKNTLKIDGITSELKNISTDYVLILDGKDTCILKSLDEGFIEKFNDTNLDIIFNYQNGVYPRVLSPSKFDHLNAGVCFGKTDCLKIFYDKCFELNKTHEYISKYNSKPSEQYIVKLAAIEMDTSLKIGVDSKRELFVTPSVGVFHN